MSRFFVSEQQGRRAHPGLLLDRYLDLDKPEWRSVAGRRLDDPAYRLAYRRWETHWTQNPPAGRLCIKGKIKGRLAIGLGAKGVLEIGLRLHHSYGTPLIPGSSIKGVLCPNPEEDPALCEATRFLFGSQDQMGYADFQDAWWVPEAQSPLALDVITAHHPNYYGGTAAPSDCDSPNPVQFLSVRGTFLFVAEAPDQPWRDYLEALLQKTLEERGIGAKTAAGYGRFSFE